MFPFNRSFHPDDYKLLRPYVDRMQQFNNTRLDSVFYRLDHPHRFWEYANVLHQLEQLSVLKTALIHDTGSGGSFFPLFLKVEAGYENVSVSDSMAYGDITPLLVEQCQHLGIDLPLYKMPLEEMVPVVGENAFDVTLCISVIEHVDSSKFYEAADSLRRVTKPGGYVFVTSDFFRDREQWEKSPFKQIQHNIFTPENASEWMEMGFDSIGGEDFSYRGDYVHNYSFVNFCLRVWKE